MMQCPACATDSGPTTWTCPECGLTIHQALLDQLRHWQFLVTWLEHQPAPDAWRDRARQELRLAQLALLRPSLPEELALSRLALTQTYAWQEAGVVSAAAAQRLENLLARRTRALAAGWPAASAPAVSAAQVRAYLLSHLADWMEGANLLLEEQRRLWVYVQGPESRPADPSAGR